jgi:hypothetical protein
MRYVHCSQNQVKYPVDNIHALVVNQHYIKVLQKLFLSVLHL